jgi:hypothetical protein
MDLVMADRHTYQSKPSGFNNAQTPERGLGLKYKHFQLRGQTTTSKARKEEIRGEKRPVYWSKPLTHRAIRCPATP